MNLTDTDARARFTVARHAYLATADGDGRPHLVPVTFAADDDTVLIAVDHKPKRSTDLKRLRNIAANARVSLLVDVYDDDWSKLWWVRADGTARVLTEPEDRSGPLRLLAAKYPIYADQVPTGPVISIRVHTWTGWAYGPGNSEVAGSGVA